MTLLNATSILLDFVKTEAPEDPHIKRAVKRMERRLAVLQLRSAKALLRRRHKGWADLLHLAESCPACGIKFSFGDFAKTALLNSRGDILNFDCPDCGVTVVRLWIEEGNPKCSAYIGAAVTMPPEFSERYLKETGS